MIPQGKNKLLSIFLDYFGIANSSYMPTDVNVHTPLTGIYIKCLHKTPHISGSVNFPAEIEMQSYKSTVVLTNEIP